MSGVIIDGQQWERCNGCGEWIEIEKLHYERPSVEHEFGRDLCEACARRSTRQPTVPPQDIIRVEVTKSAAR